MNDLLLLLGRLHPLAVHLPIGIFMLLALVELGALFPGMPRLGRPQRTVVLSAGAAFAIATALFGWLLARDGGYEGELLQRHQWLGVAVAVCSVVVLVIHLLGWRRTYAGALTLMIVLTVAAGHLGGSLTHGEGYLTAVARTPKRTPPADPAQAMVFEDVIHPILQQRCASCHGPTKSNGDLRLDTLEEMLKGGKNGPVFQPGNAAASAMIRRMHLPLDAKEHMPPKGKPQPSDDEATLLEWWIEAGAPTDKRVADLEPPPLVSEMIATQLGIPPVPPPDRAAMLAAAQELERKLGIIVRPLAANEPWLAANARLKFDQFGDAQLAELAPIAPALYWLDIGETAVTDEGLRSLAGMKELRRLQLDRTAVTDAGLEHLAPLTRLEMLNLHGTKISDRGLQRLHKLPRLRSVYLWQTKVTPAGVERLTRAQTDQRKIARLKAEIAALEAAIRAEHFNANLGSPLEKVPEPPMPKPPGETAAATSSQSDNPKEAAGPVNSNCPVSGQAVDPRVTEIVDGKIIAFCCGDCRKRFQEEPEKFPIK